MLSYAFRLSLPGVFSLPGRRLEGGYLMLNKRFFAALAGPCDSASGRDTMKFLAACLFSLTLLPPQSAHAQPVQQVHPNPDCQFFFTLTAAGSLPAGNGFDNRQQGCTSWNFSYVNSGFSGLTITVQSAANKAGNAGSWGTGFAVQQTTVSGSNAATNTTGGFWWVQGTNAFVRVTLSGVTGSGVVTGSVYGWRIPNAASHCVTSFAITFLIGDVAAGTGS